MNSLNVNFFGLSIQLDIQVTIQTNWEFILGDLIAISTAVLFKTGRAPAWPVQTGQMLVLGWAPNLVEQAQKSFDLVKSCAWTSSPITASYFIMMVFSNATLWLVHKRIPTERVFPHPDVFQ